MFFSPSIKRKKKASRFGFSVQKVSISKVILAKKRNLTSTKEAFNYINNLQLNNGHEFAQRLYAFYILKYDFLFIYY